MLNYDILTHANKVNISVLDSVKNFSFFTRRFLCKCTGFTLAEVLITLAIIGVVAAVTIPMFITNYKKQVAVTQLKKMYSTLSQALAFSVPDGDYSSLMFVDNDMRSMKNWFDSAILPHIKTVNVCYNSNGCWVPKTTQLNGGNVILDHGTRGLGECIIVFNTLDGYSVNLDGWSKYDALRIFGVKANMDTMVASVDINGKNLPNVIGKDIFVFVYSNRGLVPAGHDLTDAQVNASCNKTGNGYFCFEKIIRNNWQIDKNNLW